MRITQWGEYGILCTLYLDEKTLSGSKSVTAQEISQSQAIDIQYTQQILQRLRKSGILSSTRGSQGGYYLSRPSSEITLYDVLKACEGDTFEIICEHKPINETSCLSDSLCMLKPIWYGLRDHIDVFLKGITIKDLGKSPVQNEELVQIFSQKSLN